MASVNEYKSGNKVGATTKGAAVGGSLAGAVGILVGYLLVKTGLETDPEVATVLSGAVITILSGVGALIGGKLSPTSEGDASYAQEAVEQVQLMAERLAAAQATGPTEYAVPAGEEPVTTAYAATGEELAATQETYRMLGDTETADEAWKRLGFGGSNND